jgi:hypothetical protein
MFADERLRLVERAREDVDVLPCADVAEHEGRVALRFSPRRLARCVASPRTRR